MPATALAKLLSISSAPLGPDSPHAGFDLAGPDRLIGAQLGSLLEMRNGFYAFESALHVFPVAAIGREMDLPSWNSADLWRMEYGELAGSALFFAEDAFGNQFCIHDGSLWSFDAETGARTAPAGDLEGWAGRILADYNVLTGYPLLHRWQEVHGPLPPGTRLMPKIPFVLGGEYSLENLYPLSSISAMRSRGNLARQLKDLPDGTKVEFRVIE